MENLNLFKKIILGMQLLFVAFGALVLVPLLTGLNPSIALFTAGIGTLVYHLITKRIVPIFLASSFAFIAPMIVSMKTYGVSATLGSLMLSGLVFMLFAILIKVKGQNIIDKYLPPVVIAPIIMVIGLKLAPVAINMAKSLDGTGKLNNTALVISMISLATTILVVLKGKKLLSLIPILSGIIVGYVVSLFFGIVDFQKLVNAPWISVPWLDAIKSNQWALPTFNLNSILLIVPVAIAPSLEHIGGIYAISSVAEKDYTKNPGLHRSLFGDGVATSVAGFLGGPPCTTYAEVTGAIALLKIVDASLLRIAAVFAIILAFFGKLAAFLNTIPVPVMGGIMVLLFGMITNIGIQTIVREKVDLTQPRNLVIVAVILVFGIGDMMIGTEQLNLSGIGLAGIVGMLLNIILPKNK